MSLESLSNEELLKYLEELKALKRKQEALQNEKRDPLDDLSDEELLKIYEAHKKKEREEESWLKTIPRRAAMLGKDVVSSGAGLVDLAMMTPAVAKGVLKAIGSQGEELGEFDAKEQAKAFGKEVAPAAEKHLGKGLRHKFEKSVEDLTGDELKAYTDWEKRQKAGAEFIPIGGPGALVGKGAQFLGKGAVKGATKIAGEGIASKAGEKLTRFGEKALKSSKFTPRNVAESFGTGAGLEYATENMQEGPAKELAKLGLAPVAGVATHKAITGAQKAAAETGLYKPKMVETSFGKLVPKEEYEEALKMADPDSWKGVDLEKLADFKAAGLPATRADVSSNKAMKLLENAADKTLTGSIPIGKVRSERQKKLEELLDFERIKDIDSVGSDLKEAITRSRSMHSKKLESIKSELEKTLERKKMDYMGNQEILPPNFLDLSPIRKKFNETSRKLSPELAEKPFEPDVQSFYDSFLKKLPYVGGESGLKPRGEIEKLLKIKGLKEVELPKEVARLNDFMHYFEKLGNKKIEFEKQGNAAAGDLKQLLLAAKETVDNHISKLGPEAKELKHKFNSLASRYIKEDKKPFNTIMGHLEAGNNIKAADLFVSEFKKDAPIYRAIKKQLPNEDVHDFGLSVIKRMGLSKEAKSGWSPTKFIGEYSVLPEPRKQDLSEMLASKFSSLKAKEDYKKKLESTLNALSHVKETIKESNTSNTELLGFLNRAQALPGEGIKEISKALAAPTAIAATAPIAGIGTALGGAVTYLAIPYMNAKWLTNQKKLNWLHDTLGAQKPEQIREQLAKLNKFGPSGRGLYRQIIKNVTNDAQKIEE